LFSTLLGSFTNFSRSLATFQTPVASTSQPNAAEQELAQVREELRLAKEKIEQASTIARNEILVKMESVMEKQLECGICSEMIVFVRIDHSASQKLSF